MSSISVELSTTASPTATGKFEVNSNVETPTSGTPGTYRQLQGNIRGDSPSSTSATKPTSDMEVSGGIQLTAGIDGGKGDGGGRGGMETGDAHKQVKFDQKVSSSEDEELSLEGGGKGGKPGGKKKRRIHLSFPRFGGKGKKPTHDVVATDSTESDEVPEKKAKVEDKEAAAAREDDSNEQKEGKIEIKSDEMSGSEQAERNVDISGCGDAEARANMADTGQQEELDNGSRTAGARVSTGFHVSGDGAEFNEQGKEAESTGEGDNNVAVGVDVNVDIGGVGGRSGNHTTAPPFLDADKSKEVPDRSATEDQPPKMNTIEVKLAGMHSNIGCMEADLAEADLRASLILEDPPPDLHLDNTSADDAEKVLADTSALLEAGVDFDIDANVDGKGDDADFATTDNDEIVADSNALLKSGVNVDADVACDDSNSTSALLEEIAQTIHAIEEAGGGDGPGGGMDFSLEIDSDEDDEDIHVPKMDLGDMSEDSDTIPEEDEDVEDDDVDVGVEVTGEADISDSRASTKALAGSILEAPNGDAQIDGSVKADIDLDTGETAPGVKALCVDGVKVSLEDTKSTEDSNKEVVPSVDAKVKAQSGSAKVDLDLVKPKTDKTDSTRKSKILPLANVDAKHANAGGGEKKKKSTKGSFHFHFPRFGGSKKARSKHADVSLDTDDLLGDIPTNGPQVTMVADVKDGGNTATLHVVTEPQFKSDIKRSASFEVKPPKKPPRDPSVDSSDISGLELDVEISFLKPSGQEDEVKLEGDVELPDLDAKIQDPSMKIEPDMDIDINVNKPGVDVKGPLEIDLQREADIPDQSMEIDLKQDVDITLSTPDADINVPDQSRDIELEHDTDINIPDVKGDADVKGTPDVNGHLHLDTDVNVPQVNGNIEAPGTSGIIEANGVQRAKPSVDLDINGRNTKDVKKNNKDLNLKNKDAELELDIKAKRKAKQERKARHKRKAFTLPSLHFKSARARHAAQLETDGVLGADGDINGVTIQMEGPEVSADGRMEADGEANGGVVKVDVPDVAAGVSVDGVDQKPFGARLPGDGSSDGGGPTIDLDVGGTAECNSLPKNSLQRTASADTNGSLEVHRKDKSKKRNFTFPSIHFSFPKFGGGKQKQKSPEKDINAKIGASVDVDVNGDVFVHGDANGQVPSVEAPDVQMDVVEEVEIRAEVKRPDVEDIGGKLACLGGTADVDGEIDYDMEFNGNTTDEMKLNMAGNLPDICNHEKADIELSAGADVNGVEINGVENKGEIGVEVSDEVSIKPMEASVNFATMPPSTDHPPMEASVNFAAMPPSTDHPPPRDKPSREELFKVLADIGDMSYDGDISFEAIGPAVDVDVDYDATDLQQIDESDMCVHTAVDVDPCIDLGDKLAGLHVAASDVPGQPLEVNVAMNGQSSPKLDVKEPKLDVDVKGDTKVQGKRLNLDTSADVGQPNGMTRTTGAPPKAREGLTLDVKAPDSPDFDASGGMSLPSATQSATGSEVSFEMTTKGSKKDKKKKKKKKSKKEGKKKADGRLNMSIDLEPDATSTPVKSQNGRHMIPLTPDSGNASSLDGAITVHSNLSSPSYPEPHRRPHSVVIAIDFGTTFSGYAYSFSRDPESIQIMRKWEGGDPGVMNMKTPTTLLLTPEGEFHSFGFAARDFYHDMDHTEALNWLYFDKFKLALHNDPDLCMTTEIAAANGRKLPAIKVFEHALRFFREHAIEELCDQSTDGTFDPDEIRWVLTVPAIWKQPAKQFMRQAAYLAGIASHAYPEQLLIALEPEAASICIRELRMRELQPEKMSQRHKWIRTSMQKAGMEVKVSESITNGTRYMVVDCGGGTVDITVHEVEDQIGTLKELHKATGGACGSVNIDIAFERLLVDIFGQEYIDEYKIKRPAGWVDLMIAFEARKRNASPWKNNPLNVSLPFSFIDYYKKYTNGLSTVEEELDRYDNKDVSWSPQGMLRFTPEGMKELFKPTIAEIIQHVEDILNKDDLAGVSYLFLAGGFAQSHLLQAEMRKKFNSRLRVVIPCDVGMTILKGAVMFGTDPTAVRVRRSRLTYGVGVLNKFDAQKHPKEKYVMKDKREWCKDVFETFVKVDEAVAIGDKVTRCYTPARPNQKTLVINIYSSTSPEVKFVTEEQVSKCGALRIDVADSDVPRQGRKLHVSMQYGETELKVSAVDETTGKCVHAIIDFLNK